MEENDVGTLDPKVLTTIMDTEPKYKDLLNVFSRSCRRHMGIDPIVLATEPVDGDRHITYRCNLAKLRAFVDYVVEDDHPCYLLMDCDLLLVDSILDIFDHPFDLMITEKPKGRRYPYNVGVVGIRRTERSLLFLKEWLSAAERLYEDQARHKYYHKIYAGINQAALGYMKDLLLIDPKSVTYLPTTVYNASDPADWKRIEREGWGETKVVHLKSGLRRAVFSGNTRAYPRIIGEYNGYL